jgi:hypothetical protein
LLLSLFTLLNFSLNASAGPLSPKDCVMDVFQLDQFASSTTPSSRNLPSFIFLAQRCSPLSDARGPIFVPHGTTCNASETCKTMEMMATQWVCDNGVFIWDELYVQDKATWCHLWRHCDFDSENLSLTCEAEKRVEGTRADRLPLNLDPRLRSLTVVGEAAQLLPEQGMVRLEALEVSGWQSCLGSKVAALVAEESES